MEVAIPPEFERFAREQVKAGIVASEQEAVAAALRDYLEHVKALRDLVDPESTALDRGDVVDGKTFMAGLLAKARARVPRLG